MIAFTTALNVSGTRLLARVAMFGFVCELIGAILVGGWLLIAARHQQLSILFDTTGFGSGTAYLPALLASSVAAMFCYYGFEACGDVAEETPNAGVAIPKSMRMTIYVGGGAAIFVCLALLLAIPDLPAAVSGAERQARRSASCLSWEPNRHASYATERNLKFLSLKLLLATS